MESQDPLVDFEGISGDDERELRAACLSGLSSNDPRKIFDSVQSIRWFRDDDGVLEALLDLLGSPEEALRALAMDGLANLGHGDAVGPLIAHLSRGIASPEEAAHGMGVIGQIGSGGALAFLEQIVWAGNAQDVDVRSRALEAILSIAGRGHDAALPLLEAAHASEELEAPIKEAAGFALRELGTADWDDRGFATLEARVAPKTDPEPES